MYSVECRVLEGCNVLWLQMFCVMVNVIILIPPNTLLHSHVLWDAQLLAFCFVNGTCRANMNNNEGLGNCI